MEYQSPQLQTLTGEVRAFSPDVEETREVEFVISTPARDRHHTVLNPRRWVLEPYNRNPVVGYQHNLYGDLCNPPNPDDVIGSGRVWLEGDRLIGAVRFEPAELNPLAEKVFRKVLAGTLRATSVGFIPLMDPETGAYGRWGEGEEAQGRANETFYLYGQELVEFSIVNIPSNPDALRRGLRDQTAHALMYLRRVTGLEFRQIEGMTVREVLDALEGVRTPGAALSPDGTKGSTIPQIPPPPLQPASTEAPPADAADAGAYRTAAIRKALRQLALSQAIRSSR